jgi:hypothetical protein
MTMTEGSPRVRSKQQHPAPSMPHHAPRRRGGAAGGSKVGLGEAGWLADCSSGGCDDTTYALGVPCTRAQRGAWSSGCRGPAPRRCTARCRRSSRPRAAR